MTFAGENFSRPSIDLSWDELVWTLDLNLSFEFKVEAELGHIGVLDIQLHILCEM